MKLFTVGLAIVTMVGASTSFAQVCNLACEDPGVCVANPTDATLADAEAAGVEE